MPKLNGNDREIIKQMQELGMSRVLACTIVWLKSNGGFSTDIEDGTGLKQPEVSTAIRNLRDLGWLEEEKVQGSSPDGSKLIGRPRVRFSLRVGAEEILEYSIRDGVDRIRNTEESINHLERLLTG